MISYYGCLIFDYWRLVLGTVPTMRAGLPAAIEKAGTSLVTTEPAPMTTRSPKVTPLRIMEREPIKQPRPILTGFEFTEYSVSQENPWPGIWKSLSRIIDPAPKMVSSPISIELPATIVQLLSPTRSPNRSRAVGVMVRRTQGEEPPSGLARAELSSVTQWPKEIEEPG